METSVEPKSTGTKHTVWANVPPLDRFLTTLAVEESVLSYAEKVGVLVLAVGDEIMEMKNRPGSSRNSGEPDYSLPCCASNARSRAISASATRRAAASASWGVGNNSPSSSKNRNTFTATAWLINR